MRLLIPFFLFIVSGCNTTDKLAKQIDSVIHDVNAALNREEKIPTTLQKGIEEMKNEIIKPQPNFKPSSRNLIQKKDEQPYQGIGKPILI